MEAPNREEVDNVLESAQYEALYYLARTGTRTALFINHDEGTHPDPQYIYSYHGYEQDSTTRLFWHWFYRHSDGELFTLSLDDQQDYDDEQYDMLDRPENLFYTFGIYSWSRTTGTEDKYAEKDLLWTEVEIFSRIRDFILKRVPLRYYRHMFDRNWTHPLHYTPHRRDDDDEQPPPIPTYQPETIKVTVRFRYVEAARPVLRQGVKNNEVPQGALAGGKGTFLVRGERAHFYMEFPNNPEIQAVDLYPWMVEVRPTNKRITRQVRNFLESNVNQLQSLSPEHIHEWVHRVLQAYWK